MTDADRTTHLDADGLWIPPDCREFTAQVVFRTPRATIQHFQSGGGTLDAYYPMIDESHFGNLDDIQDPQNPELGPDRLSIKHQGADPVVFVVDRTTEGDR